MAVQEQDSLTPDGLEFESVAEAQPTAQMLEDLKFAWLCVKLSLIHISEPTRPY